MVYANGQVTQTLLNNFLRLPEEKLLFANRKHWFILFVRLLVLFLLTSLFSLCFLFILTIFTSQPILFTLVLLTIALLTVTLATKFIIDWYCHLYIVTNRKILEVCHSPLFFDHVSDVLLDQVRVTEVDVQRDGMINEVLDIGNVILTFDRPTHQQECILLEIQDAEKIGILLGSTLVDGMRRTTPENTIWYRKPKDDRKQSLFRFTEEIFPGNGGATQRLAGA